MSRNILIADSGSTKTDWAIVTSLPQPVVLNTQGINPVHQSREEVVNIIRQFNDAFQSVTAKREIKKKLRSILWIKYQIKDNEVFEKAYCSYFYCFERKITEGLKK